MFRSRFVEVTNSFVLVLALVWMTTGAGSSVAGQDDPADLERLRQRVSGYFTAVHSGQFAAAEQFILHRSRDSFGRGRKQRSRITGFSIVEVTPEGGRGSAVVAVKLEVMAPIVAGRFPVQQKFRWKKESGEWFFDPADPPRTNSNLFQEYYLEKQSARANPKAGEGPQPVSVEFEETAHEFEWVLQGDPVQIRFPFRNLTSDDLVVKKIYGPDWLIEDRTEKRLIPAGESGEIVVDVNTANLRLEIGQDIFVRFEPIKELVKLRIKGRVFTAEDVARSPSLSEEAAARKAAQSATP
ncbi:MAG: DUF1573 domain-containing protein [Acidobacteria bacterium]|nr:DUF1573 domain-containing protein [Acidobacteriota bacterium]